MQEKNEETWISDACKTANTRFFYTKLDNLKRHIKNLKSNAFNELTPASLNNTLEPTAFMIDLDMQFAMVPWEWIKRLLTQRLLAQERKCEEISTD